MTAIICLDEENGVSFNNRRQSQDRYLMHDIMKTVGFASIAIENYSALLFSNLAARLRIVDDIYNHDEPYCFVERHDMNGAEKIFDKIIIYRWADKTYPSDIKFKMDLSAFTLVSQSEIAGHSHNVITKEIYCK